MGWLALIFFIIISLSYCFPRAEATNDEEILIHVYVTHLKQFQTIDLSCICKELIPHIEMKHRLLFYNLVNKANLVHNFSQCVYFFSLHVSGDYVPIIRRNNCICATLGICHSVWMTVWYAGCICTLHTTQSSTQSDIYQVSHRYSCFS